MINTDKKDLCILFGQLKNTWVKILSIIQIQATKWEEKMTERRKKTIKIKHQT